MTDHPERDPDRPLYPVDRAYVVEMQRDAEPGSGVCLGRIEHVASGRVARFGDVDTLLRFLAEGHAEESAVDASPAIGPHDPGPSPVAPAGAGTEPGPFDPGTGGSPRTGVR